MRRMRLEITISAIWAKQWICAPRHLYIVTIIRQDNSPITTSMALERPRPGGSKLPWMRQSTHKLRPICRAKFGGGNFGLAARLFTNTLGAWRSPAPDQPPAKEWECTAALYVFACGNKSRTHTCWWSEHIESLEQRRCCSTHLQTIRPAAF